MLLSRVLGIFREMLLAHAAGVSLEKNALDLAFMIPDILNHVVSTGFLSIIFIPIFTGYKVAGDEKGGWKFFSNVLNTFGIALLILVVPAFIWMKELLQLLTVDGATPELIERATYYGRIILPGQAHNSRVETLPQRLFGLQCLKYLLSGPLWKKHSTPFYLLSWRMVS